MVRILSRVLALVFAVALVGGASWALSRPYYRSVFGSWGREFNCMCIVYPNMPLSADWPLFDAGAFRVKAPKGTMLSRDGDYHGVIRDPRFTLFYCLDDRVPDAVFAKFGRYYREEDVTVGGRPGVVRWASFPDRKEPEFLQLFLPRAVQAKDGRWLALEIHGWLTTPERRWLAEHVVRSVDFTPVFDKLVTPTRPHVDPPTIEIIYPSAKETP